MNTEMSSPKRLRVPRIRYATRHDRQSLAGFYPRAQHGISRYGYVLLIICSTLGLVACSLSDLVDVDTSNNLITPDQVSTEAGAMQLYGGVIHLLNMAYGGGYSRAYGDVVVSGIFSDEFQDTSALGIVIDQRSMNNTGNRVFELYQKLQYVRTQGLQAAAAMRVFPEKIPSPLIGRVYASVGYAELLLAERFCSGVPLSIIPPGGGAITYAPGLTTSQLFERAVAHFDTAVSLIGTDSLGFLHLAQVGKARALIGLGQYTEAREAILDVPTNFVYYAEFTAADTNAVRPQTGGSMFTSGIGEGINGINWLAAQDPRVPIKDTVKGLVRSSKYPTATSPIVIADGIEARLIEAEADLRDENPRWLTTLNQLRSRMLDGGGARMLVDTADPGTPAARVDLLFYERAFWLYATGHRHGDMRRLVRQYGRPASTVFPSGFYTPMRAVSSLSPNYEEAVALPVINNTNPYVKGCLDTNA